MSKIPGSSDQHSLIASQTATSALFGANAPYLEDLYERYLACEAVDPQWQAYFDGLRAGSAERAHGPIIRELEQRAQSPRRAVAAAVATGADSNSEKQAAVSRLVQIYTNRGHLIAKLDPLGLMQRPIPRVLQLDKTRFGNRVSHANNKTRRTWEPNMQSKRFWVATENKFVRLRISAQGIKMIDKVGIDAVLADLRKRGVKA